MVWHSNHRYKTCAQFRANLRQEWENSSTIELKAINSDSDAADGDDSEIVKLMVNYMYHLDYLPAKHDSPNLGTDPSMRPILPVPEEDAQKTGRDHFKTAPKAEVNLIVIHAKVFALAVKYQIDGLRRLAEKNFYTETTD